MALIILQKYQYFFFVYLLASELCQRETEVFWNKSNYKAKPLNFIQICLFTV